MYSRIEKSVVSGPSSCIGSALKSGKTILVCLSIMLVFASTSFSNVLIGNFESADSNDGWIPGVGDANAVLIPASANGVTFDSGSLAVIPSETGNYWTLGWEGSPVDLTDTALQFDLTMLVSEWSVGVWTKVADKIAINSDVNQVDGTIGTGGGWKEYANLASAIDRDTLEATGLDWGRWWDGAPDNKKTYTLDISDYDAAGASYLQVHISTQGRDATAAFYFDNIRLLTPDMTVSKCKVSAGKTQYHGDEDYNDMKDYFTASGTLMLPSDCNDVNEVEVTITSNADDEVIYTETLSDFNASIVNSTGKYKYSARATKGQAGKITSLTLDFRKSTFSIATKNIDLTGLACPFEIKFNLGSFEQKGNTNEVVVNGSRKTIPTRLMRLYDDKLVVTRARAKNSTSVSSDTLCVKGEIAVADMNVDANEPNLVNEDVNITWGDVNDTNTQTFIIPAGSFKASKKGHTYKCSKIEADANDGNSGIVTATIDLDKCTFTVSVKDADGLYADELGESVFGMSFDTPESEFNEEDEYTLP